MKKLNKRLLELYSDRKQILFMSFLGYISYLAQDTIPSDPSVIYSTWGMIVVGVVGAGVTAYNASKNREAAEGMANEAKTERNRQQAALDKQKAEYKAMVFKNPFQGMENKFGENVFEDLTVNQQQAEFQQQQATQQRANIMQNLRGAAGGSGIAGLAQALSNQGALQTQRISASIGQQEAQNQQLKAKGAFEVQKGESQIQTAERQGEQWVQQAQMDRKATLLGMQMGETTGANLAMQQAQANQMNAQIAQQQSTADLIGGFAQGAGQLSGGTDENIFTGKKREAWAAEDTDLSFKDWKKSN